MVDVPQLLALGMAILSAGADIRPGRRGRRCHFSPAGQTRTRPANRRVRARVSFPTHGYPKFRLC